MKGTSAAFCLDFIYFNCWKQVRGKWLEISFNGKPTFWSTPSLFWGTAPGLPWPSTSKHPLASCSCHGFEFLLSWPLSQHSVLSCTSQFAVVSWSCPYKFSVTKRLTWSLLSSSILEKQNKRKHQRAQSPTGELGEIQRPLNLGADDISLYRCLFLAKHTVDKKVSTEHM